MFGNWNLVVLKTEGRLLDENLSEESLCFIEVFLRFIFYCLVLALLEIKMPSHLILDDFFINFAFYQILCRGKDILVEKF